MIKKRSICLVITLLAWVSALNAVEEEYVQFDFRIYMWPEQRAIAVAPLQVERSETTGVARSLLGGQSGQPSGSPAKEGAPVVDNYRSPEISYLADGVRDVVPLSLGKGRLSQTYHYHGAPVVHFFEGEPSVTAEGPAPIPLAQVSVSPTVKELIFFFFPVGDGSYRVLPVDSSLSSVKSGNALVYNLSDVSLACSLGGPMFELHPNQSKLHSLGSIDGVYQPVVAASQAQNGKWKKQIERKLSIDEGSSMLLVLYNLSSRPSRFKLLPLRLDHGGGSAM
jgi:hypothetical protein